MTTDDKRACHGAGTKDCRMGDMGHGQECQYCGRKVRNGYENHSFFGFKQCAEKYKRVAKPPAHNYELTDATAHLGEVP